MESLSCTWWLCPLCQRPFSPATAEGHILSFHSGSGGPSLVWRCGECPLEVGSFAEASSHCLSQFHAAAKLHWALRRGNDDPDETRRLLVSTLSRMQATTFERIRLLGGKAAAKVPPMEPPPAPKSVRSSSRLNAGSPSMAPNFRRPESAASRTPPRASATATPVVPKLWRNIPAGAATPIPKLDESRLSVRDPETIDLEEGSGGIQAAIRDAMAMPPPSKRPKDELNESRSSAGGTRPQAYCVECDELVYPRVEVRSMHRHVVKSHGTELSAEGVAQHTCGECGEVFQARSQGDKHVAKVHPDAGAPLELDQVFITRAWEVMLKCFPTLEERWTPDMLQQKRDHFSFYF